jgi:hypothetical protein
MDSLSLHLDISHISIATLDPPDIVAVAGSYISLLRLRLSLTTKTRRQGQMGDGIDFLISDF